MALFETLAQRARVQTSAARHLLRTGTSRSLVPLYQASRSYYRVLWLGAAVREGVLSALRDGPLPLATLAGRLDLPGEALEGLGAWLDLGVSVGLLRRTGGGAGASYALRGPARVLARADHDALAAFFTELVDLHHPLVATGVGRLREGRPFTFAETDPEVIARSSRIAEPYLAAALEAVVPAEGPVRLVEVGCGSAAHIRTAAGLNPSLTALGLELQEPAAELARRNLASWGLADRVDVEVGDVRERTGTGDADLVTLHQNVYYFPVDERADLFRHLATFLAPGGRLLVTSIVRSGSHSAAGLDLWGALTDGGARLPEDAELLAQLRAAGYTEVESVALTPDGLFRAFTGVRPA